MAFTRIILWLGNTLIFCAFMAALTAVAAVFFAEFGLASQFAGLGIAVGGLGIIFILTSYNTPARDSNAEALWFLLLFWSLVPVICAVPYWTSGVTHAGLIAYFEAVSAITTTGASTLDADSLPRSLHFWRSLLQWWGGVFAATFAVVILAALNITGTGIHRSILFTLKRGDLFPRLLAIGRIIAGIYACISAMCFLGLSISGTSIFESLCLSLTSVSTGGLTPRSDVLAQYVSPFGAAIMALSCVLGAISIAVLWDVFRLRSWMSIRRLFTNVEQRGLFVICCIMIVVGVFYTGPLHLSTVAYEAFFFVSSAGFDYHVIGVEMLPPAVLIFVALIGGAALSTAGGVKIIRILLLFRHVATDLSRLTHPSRVLPVKFRGRTIPDRAFLSIWMYFFGYTLLLALVILALSATGVNFETASIAGAATMSNMGPLLEAISDSQTYRDFSNFQLLLLSIVMLLGRVEVLAMLAMTFPSTWRQ